MKKFLLLLLAIIPLLSNAQIAFDRYFTFNTWTRGNQILEVPGRGYYVVGIDDSLTTDSVGNPSVDFNQGIIANFDLQGNLLASKKYGNGDSAYFLNYGSNSDDLFRSVIMMNDNNLLVAGETQSYNAQNFYDYDFLLFKITPNLDTLWTTTFSLPDSSLILNYAYCKKTLNNGIVFPGHQKGFYENGIHFQLSEFDSIGNLIFHKLILPQFNGELLGVVESTDLGFISVGLYYSDFTNGLSSPIILKTDSIGNVDWYQILPYSGDRHYAQDIIKTIDGNYIYTWGNVVQNPGALHKVYINHATKIDIMGNEIWTKNYGYTYDSFQRIKELPNANFMISGWYSDTLGLISGSLLQVCDSNGDTLFRRIITSNPSGLLIEIDGSNTIDGGYILSGETYCCNFNPTVGNTSSLWIAKTDSFGLITSVVNLPKPDLKNTLLGNPFPNPTSQFATISTMISPEISNAELLVFDLNGKQLQEIKIEIGYTETSINLSAYSSGEYVIALSVDGFNGGIKKVIKR